MNNKLTPVFLAIGLALVAGLGAGYWFATYQSVTAPVQEMQAERKPLYYRNPMNAEITSPVPAKDHMGMAYIPVYAEDDSTDPAGTVRIDPVTVQNIGVRTATAERRTLAREIHTIGRVDSSSVLPVCIRKRRAGSNIFALARLAKPFVVTKSCSASTRHNWFRRSKSICSR